MIAVQEEYVFYRSLVEELYKLYKDYENKDTHSSIHYFFQALISVRVRTEIIGGNHIPLEEELNINSLYNEWLTSTTEKASLKIAVKLQAKKYEKEIIQYLENAKRLEQQEKKRYYVDMKKHKGGFAVVAYV